MRAARSRSETRGGFGARRVTAVAGIVAVVGALLVVRHLADAPPTPPEPIAQTSPPIPAIPATVATQVEPTPVAVSAAPPPSAPAIAPALKLSGPDNVHVSGSVSYKRIDPSALPSHAHEGATAAAPGRLPAPTAPLPK